VKSKRTANEAHLTELEGKY